MKKGGFFRNVLDTIRSNQTANQSGRGGSAGGSASGCAGAEFGGQLKPSHFALSQVARHGFPEHPTALAYDPVQKIAAIGTKSGALWVFGRPGADVWAQHEPAHSVTHIKFVVNQGAIITVTADESIHLWSLRGPKLKLQLSLGGGGGGGNQAAASSCSPQATGGGGGSAISPSPTAAAGSNASLHSALAQAPVGAAGGASGTSASGSSSSFLGQITDTVAGAVDSASDFLSGGGSGPVASSTSSLDHHQLTPSPTSGGESARTDSRQPELLHTLKFQREHITSLHLTLSSKWLYIGTERGNLHVANVETFELSGYSIAWNKAIELSRKTHPGAIIHISECPQDTNKLLIGYESGCIVLWDLKQRNADARYYHAENLSWLAWHYEGKQFVAAHGDGSLITWQTRSNARPAQILWPHSKTAAATGSDTNQLQQQQQQSSAASSALASSLARSFNNELYRPIGKVDWKTAKNNEQFLLFSGGLPHDSLDSQQPQELVSAKPAAQLRQSAGPSPARATQQSLSAASSGVATASSPISPSISPGGAVTQQLKDKASLRSTSLTVMYGKSITVLEMDGTIVDFITICDNSPYENDTSEPQAVIVLLSDELVLIDLTSPGYPSFDSPYPSASLSDSQVTCVHYLADCSSDLIPFLYSTSQNVISRAPKKGFSDKEWPINGGEWGQSMQSYPELVLTGHADGTIKFWDMSGVNFDLISKIRISKLFEKPSKPTGLKFVVASSPSSACSGGKRAQSAAARSSSPARGGPEAADQFVQSSSPMDAAWPSTFGDMLENQGAFDESLFAIERIEYYPSTRNLLVACAFSQVIQFKLNKQPATSSGGDVAAILVEPSIAPLAASKSIGDQFKLGNKQHSLFRVRDHNAAAACSSSSASHRNRSSGFQAELVCLTPLLVAEIQNADVCSESGAANAQANKSAKSLCGLVPPKITAIALQTSHQILAYAHEFGLVLIDIVQKCVILNASLADLYCGTPASGQSRDVSIQPYATSSILQQHYQQTNSAASNHSAGGADRRHPQPDNGAPAPPPAAHQRHQSRLDGSAADAGDDNNSQTIDNSNTTPSFTSNKSASNGQPLAGSVLGGRPASATAAAAAAQSKYTTNSMFQRQLSTNALGTSQSQSGSRAQQAAGGGPAGSPRGLFQRQMTASQLFGSGSAANGAACDGQPEAGRFARAAGVGPVQRADLKPASSSACLSATSQAAATASSLASSPNKAPSRQRAPFGGSATATAAAAEGDSQRRPPPKNKRVISRMLSISAIQTSVGALAGAASELQADEWRPPNGQQTIASEPEHHQQPDKFADSPFGRSRSSSGSSVTGQPQQVSLVEPPQTCLESIQRIAFVEPTTTSFAASGERGGGASAASSPSAASASGGNLPGGSTSSSTSSSSGGGGGGGTGGGALTSQVQSSGANPNHKSLGSIDNQQLGGQQLALLAGTSSGSVLVVGLQMPDSDDNRVLQLQSINAEPLPQASARLAGRILSLGTFTCEANRARQQHAGASVAAAGATASSAGGAQTTQAATAAQQQLQKKSPSSSLEGDAQLASPPGGRLEHSQGSLEQRTGVFFAVVSSKQARVYHVPAVSAPAAAASPAEWPLCKMLVARQHLFAQCDLSETSFACHSAVVHFRQPDEPCLVSYLASGNLVAHALPRLRPALMDSDLVAYTAPSVSESMCFSRNGHCLYRPSANEISKFTICAQYKALVNEMTGLLYVPRDMPEMPRTNFFKSLFSVSQLAKQTDRDELFGSDAAGKPSRNVARHLGASSAIGGGACSRDSTSGAAGERAAGAGGLKKLESAAIGGMGHELRFAREGLDERGEKLSELEDGTLQMLNQSESYASSAHQLAQKFRDKKWYQF